MGNPLKNKTVFIGVGAQKAGTTWLNDTLLKYDSVATPHIKELHYFDIKWLDKDINTISIYKSRAKELKQISNNITTAILSKCELFENDPKQQEKIFDKNYLDKYELKKRCERIIDLANVLSIKNDSDYIEYFAKLSIGKEVVGEITPSYSLLQQEGFKNIKTLIPHVKIIYIMRDPVDRFISQLKFKGKRHASRGLDEYNILENFEDMLNNVNFIKRADYETTLRNTKENFDSNHLLILFYEKLLYEDTVGQYRKIETYLNLKPKENKEIFSWKDEKSNVTKKIEIPNNLKKMAGKKLKDIYEYVFKEFEDVPQRWRDNYNEFCI